MNIVVKRSCPEGPKDSEILPYDVHEGSVTFYRSSSTTKMRFRLGKKPARLNAVRFRLSRYVDLGTLPKPPDEFGHGLALSDWGLLGNADWGDCVFAGAAHETMLWRRLAKLWYGFDDKSVLSDYSAVTGFNPVDPNTDGGADMAQVAEYRRTVGIVDSLGWRHRVVAYMAIDPGNVQQLYTATYLFDAVGVGIRFPQSAMDQFNAGDPWSVVSGSPIEGGHYVPVVGKRNGLIDLVTWGRLQQMTPEFYTAMCDEVIVYLTIENLLAGKTPEGFSTVQLLSDLAALKPQPASAVLSKPPDHIPPPHHKHLVEAISELGEAIDRLTQKIETKNRLFVLQTGKDQPIPKGQT